MTKQPDLLSTRQVAEVLNLHRNSIKAMVGRGELQPLIAQRGRRRRWFFDPADVEALRLEREPRKRPRP